MTATLSLDAVASSFETVWSDLFRCVWRKNTRKHLARALNISERRAKDLVEARSRPSADEMLTLAVGNADLRALLLRTYRDVANAQSAANGQLSQAFSASRRASVRGAGSGGASVPLALCPLVPSRRSARGIAACAADASGVKR